MATAISAIHVNADPSTASLDANSFPTRLAASSSSASSSLKLLPTAASVKLIPTAETPKLIPTVEDSVQLSDSAQQYLDSSQSKLADTNSSLLDQIARAAAASDYALSV